MVESGFKPGAVTVLPTTPHSLPKLRSVPGKVLRTLSNNPRDKVVDTKEPQRQAPQAKRGRQPRSRG